MMRSKPQFNAFTAQMSLPDYSLGRGAHYWYEHIHYMQTLCKLSRQNSAKERASSSRLTQYGDVSTLSLI